MKKHLFILLFFILGINHLIAHEVRPAFLKITQTSETEYNVQWKVPTLNNLVPRINPVFPQGFKLTQIKEQLRAGAVIKYYNGIYEESLAGNRITISELQQTLIDVIIVVELLDGAVHSLIVQADNPSVIIPKVPSLLEVIKDYTMLGLEHIWAGIDHLLFVLCLLLLINGFSNLIKTITAFTLAHSITLALSTLELVSLPGPPVEAIIALSILFLAREYLTTLKGQKSLTASYPWIVAFIFGLLHGFGFAGALSDIGLPQQQIAPSLLFFNIGIELGQILFVIAALALFTIAKKLSSTALINSRIYLAYGIGSVAAYWLIERMLNF